jgi:hypothetical protein
MLAIRSSAFIRASWRACRPCGTAAQRPLGHVDIDVMSRRAARSSFFRRALRTSVKCVDAEPSGLPTRPPGPHPSSGPCYLCKLVGHTTATCPYRIAPGHGCTAAATAGDGTRGLAGGLGARRNVFGTLQSRECHGRWVTALACATVLRAWARALSWRP